MCRRHCDIICQRRKSLSSQSTLVTVFVAILLAAPLARAQEASVTLYGRLNVDMEVVNGKQTGPGCPETCPNPAKFRVNSNSSLFGIRGAEPLGDGVSTIFQIESGLSVTEGRGVLASRETFLGLSGPLGTFKMGYFLGPYDDILPIFGNVPTLTTSILSTAALWAQGFLGPPEAGGFDDRLRQSIRYDAEDVGFNASLSTRPPTAGCRQSLSALARPTPTPMQLGIAYESITSPRTPKPVTDHALSIAGGYQFPLLRVAAVYERLEYDATTTTRLKRNFYGIGATADVGPGLMYAFVGRAGNGTGSAVDGTRIGGLTKGDSTASTQWGSYTYVCRAHAGVRGLRQDPNEANQPHSPESYSILCASTLL
jgi:predicted porin